MPENIICIISTLLEHLLFLFKLHFSKNSQSLNNFQYKFSEFLVSYLKNQIRIKNLKKYIQMKMNLCIYITLNENSRWYKLPSPLGSPKLSRCSVYKKGSHLEILERKGCHWILVGFLHMLKGGKKKIHIFDILKRWVFHISLKS